MGALAETCESLGLPYRFFGFDSAISEVVNYAKKIDAWMKAGGREQIAQRLGHHHRCVKKETTMHARGIPEGFPYYLGIHSLADIATRGDRVCVLNILGGESRQVTPTSHAFSGGNVVFGTSPGRGGQVLTTTIGDIPVFNNVREGLDAGHAFNTGVVYLPPSGVRDGVAELIRVNPDLRKIVIITEKIAVHDAREIRAMAQANGVDIIGGNCLGVADSLEPRAHRRRARRRPSGRVAAQGLGRDLLELGRLHDDDRAVPRRPKAGARRRSSRRARTSTSTTPRATSPMRCATTAARAAAVLYAEPGGYYEHGIDWGKPVVACVVGRWKSKLTRAVGHAGAMAGSGDRAEDKERWFMEAFGVDAIFTPENPVVSKKGAVVTNIAHIPAALTAVMALERRAKPDFAPRGSLALKPWIANDQGLELPPELALPPVTAPEPYAAQIAALGRQVGAVIARQNMKDKSGASVMDPKTQVTSVHGHSVLDLALQPLQANFALPLVHEIAGAERPGAARHRGRGRGQPGRRPDPRRSRSGARGRQLAEHGDGGGGGDRRAQARRARAGLHAGADRPLRRHSALKDGHDDDFDLSSDRGRRGDARAVHGDATTRRTTRAPRRCCAAVEARGGEVGRSSTSCCGMGGRLSRDAILAAIATTIAWGPLMRKRISRLTAETLPWYLRLYGVMVGASIPRRAPPVGHRLRGIPRAERFGSWTMADLCFLAMTGKKPTPERGAAAADPDRPADLERPGLDLGAGRQGRGLGRRPADARPRADQQGDGRLPDPHRLQPRRQRLRGHGLPARAVQGHEPEGPDRPEPRHRPEGDGDRVRQELQGREEARRRNSGQELRALPGVHHPVFKGKPVNHDPRERFIAEFMAERGQLQRVPRLLPRAGAGAVRRRARRPTCSASTSTR